MFIYTHIYIISQISASLMGKMIKIDRAEQNRMLKTQGTLLASDIQIFSIPLLVNLRGSKQTH